MHGLLWCTWGMFRQLLGWGDLVSMPHSPGSLFPSQGTLALVVSGDKVRGLQGQPLGGGQGSCIFPTLEAGSEVEKRWQSRRTTIDKRKLEPTKKDTLHPKTERKPQWDGTRGTIVIKSNAIPAGWATHKLENNYITEVLHRSESFEPDIRLPGLEFSTTRPALQQMLKELL